MMDNHLITVIVPVYNAEKNLAVCLDSILGQTHRTLEVIVVDDGSTDRSGGICDTYAVKDTRVRVIHKQNAGVSTARNCGIDAVCGAFFMFVDSDDQLAMNACEVLLRKITETGADMAAAGVRLVYDTPDIPKIPEPLLLSGLLQGGIINKANICGLIKAIIGREAWRGGVYPQEMTYAWCKLYRTKKFANCRFPEGIFFSEDIVYILDILRCCDCIAYTDTVLYHYRQHVQSVTRTFHAGYAANFLRLAELTRNYISRYFDRPEFWRAYYCGLGSITRTCAENYFAVGLTAKNYRVRHSLYNSLFVNEDFRSGLKIYRSAGLPRKFEVFLLRHNRICILCFYYGLKRLIKKVTAKK